MRESVLRDYFLGLVDETRFLEDFAGSSVKTSNNRTSHLITDDLVGEFEVSTTHLIRLCDAFLTGSIHAEHLEFIGFALEASDCFCWENDSTGAEDGPVAQTIHAWASPEINYPLTREVIANFRHLLQTGDSLFTKEDF